jgi:hypothetical protein
VHDSNCVETAGSDKTALAVYWAHQMADRFASGVRASPLRTTRPSTMFANHGAVGGGQRAGVDGGAQVPLSLGLRVIPVLTGDASLPAEADLPQDIAGHAYRAAAGSSGYWRYGGDFRDRWHCRCG